MAERLAGKEFSDRAAQGIGRAMRKLALREGAALFLVDRRALLVQAVAELKVLGPSPMR